LYAFSKFIGGKWKIVLNASSRSLDSCASIIIIGSMIESYDWMSRILLSWNCYGLCRSLIGAFCNWLSYMSRQLSIIVLVVQWSSPSCQSLMFLSFSSVLSCCDLIAPPSLDSIYSWLVFSCVQSTMSPLLIYDRYMDQMIVSLD